MQYKLFTLLIFTLLSSCVPYKYPSKDFKHLKLSTCTSENSKTTTEDYLAHPLYSIIPRHRSQIYWYDVGHWLTWAAFGNDDDGIFGEEKTAFYKMDKPPSLAKAFQWALRNPFHNFCFYVIGSAHRPNSEWILISLSETKCESLTYHPLAKQNFSAHDESGLLLALHGGKPFISFRFCHSNGRKSEFYLGWRERGNFGAKCHLWKQEVKKS